jgi:hypothetical protein
MREKASRKVQVTDDFYDAPDGAIIEDDEEIWERCGDCWEVTPRSSRALDGALAPSLPDSWRASRFPSAFPIP